MKGDDLIGIRPEDLDREDRERQEALLRDGAARAEHEQAHELGRALRSLPPTGGPTLERASARVRDERDRNRGASNGRWFGVATVALLAAAGAAMVLIPEAEQRDRGAPGGAVAVHLQAAAEGPFGVRALSRGDPVGVDERVIFQAQVQGVGHLVLEEQDGTRIWPPVGESWTASTGLHLPGGAGPLSYRPERGDGMLGYRVWLCTEPPERNPNADCAVDELILRWER